jgi:hypothetical protein
MVNTRSHDPYSAHAKPKTRRRAAPKKNLTPRQPAPPPPPPAPNSGGEPEPVNDSALEQALAELKAESGKE